MFEKAKAWLDDKANRAKAAWGAGVTAAAAAMTPGLAFADDPTVAGTLTTGVTSAVSQAQDAILAVLPQALVLMGIIVGITVGVRLFKKIGH